MLVLILVFILVLVLVVIESDDTSTEEDDAVDVALLLNFDFPEFTNVGALSFMSPNIPGELEEEEEKLPLVLFLGVLL